MLAESSSICSLASAAHGLLARKRRRQGPASAAPTSSLGIGAASRSFGLLLQQSTSAGTSTISLANCAFEPGVENMLGHAPPPLADNGLDMRGGHPARI